MVKNFRIDLRLSKKEKEIIQNNARVRGMRISEYLLYLAVREDSERLNHIKFKGV